MTIHSELEATVAMVAIEARQMTGFKNPFITLESLEELCQGDETLSECLNTMVVDSLRYAETVCRFQEIVMKGQESNMDNTRSEIERVRTTIHDAAMDSVNIFSRTLKRAGKGNEWISKLVAGGRSAYGKFLLFIAFEVALQGNGGSND